MVLDVGLFIFIGGGGKRVLSIAVCYVDIIGINGTMAVGVVGFDVLALMTVEVVDDKVVIVVVKGVDWFDVIELNVWVFFVSIIDDWVVIVEQLVGGL